MRKHELSERFHVPGVVPTSEQHLCEAAGIFALWVPKHCAQPARSGLLKSSSGLVYVFQELPGYR